jgi:hypothetical protein
MRGPVGIDRPDDPDVPSDKPSDHQARRAPAEIRSHEEYYTELRAAVAVQERTEPAPPSESGARSKPGKQTENDPQVQPGSNWEETAELSRWMWSEYKRRWPPEERPPADQSKDPPGSWRVDSNRFLDRAANEDTEKECDQIVKRERERLSPGLREVESLDSDRQLIGFEHRLKGRERIKEKVAEAIEQYGRTPREAVSLVPDAIRYTFQYKETRYAQGVQDDIARLREQGFELIALKNSWLDEQYKGINSRWIEPVSGQRFELQFHTRISFEAKQLTHRAYERLRSGQADEFEEMVLEAFQTKVAAAIPIPHGAADIPDHSEGERHAR